MENPALLSAVLRDPDDDVPRERYAAWCATQPDEATRLRAEFIETQLALARGEVADTYPLLYRTRRLRLEYGRQWAGGAGELADDVDFDRGFVEHVTLEALRFLEIGAELFVLAPIRHLDLTGVPLVAEVLFASPLLRPIRSLGLAGNGLTDHHLQLLASSQQLVSLRWLSLADNAIGFEGADALARSDLSRQLVYAGFRGNRIEPNERYSYDSGAVVDSWLPDDGVQLEARHQRQLPWLHHAARTIDDSVPDRFRVQPQSSGGR